MPKSMIAAFAVATNVSTAKGMLTSDLVHYGVPGTVGEGLGISGVMNITPGTGTTAIVVSCKQNAGANAGGNIGTSVTHNLAAGVPGNISFSFLDTAPNADSLPSSPGGAQNPPQNQYVVSVAQTGGTGAGTMNYGTLAVEPVTGGW
jgi:hypothetical protein